MSRHPEGRLGGLAKPDPRVPVVEHGVVLALQNENTVAERCSRGSGNKHAQQKESNRTEQNRTEQKGRRKVAKSQHGKGLRWELIPGFALDGKSGATAQTSSELPAFTNEAHHTRESRRARHEGQTTCKQDETRPPEIL